MCAVSAVFRLWLRVVEIGCERSCQLRQLKEFKDVS